LCFKYKNVEFTITTNTFLINPNICVGLKTLNGLYIINEFIQKLILKLTEPNYKPKKLIKII
jgi:hypothetical protein